MGSRGRVIKAVPNEIVLHIVEHMDATTRKCFMATSKVPTGLYSTDPFHSRRYIGPRNDKSDSDLGVGNIHAHQIQ